MFYLLYTFFQALQLKLPTYLNSLAMYTQRQENLKRKLSENSVLC